MGLTHMIFARMSLRQMSLFDSELPICGQLRKTRLKMFPFITQRESHPISSA